MIDHLDHLIVEIEKQAGHPVPDEAGEKAAHEILRRVKALTASDRLLVLVWLASRVRPR